MLERAEPRPFSVRPTLRGALPGAAAEEGVGCGSGALPLPLGWRPLLGCCCDGVFFSVSLKPLDPELLMLVEVVVELLLLFCC